MPASTRTAVVRALQRLRRENGYSNMVLDGLLSRGEIPPQDQAFASRLFYGVLERQMTLDYVLGSCSSQPLRRCHPVVLDTLRAGSYQLLFMDKIPPSAAVNEAVRCAKALKQGHASGFVNGVLQYSTCTLRREENEQVVTRFLRENPQFSPRILPISACFDAAGAPPHWYITLFPHIHQTDGFFIAGFIRNEVDA